MDFGATRTYSKEFMDNWFSILQAAALGDREACIASSLRIGYLTGEENEVRSTLLFLQRDTTLTDPPAPRPVDDARCARQLHDAARDAVQGRHPTAVLVRAGQPVGGYHGADPRPNPGDAPAPTHAAAQGDVQPESVRTVLSRPGKMLIYNFMQETERVVPAGVAAGGQRGHQGDLGQGC